MTGITDQTGHSATLDMWDLTRVNEVVFNADHENITCKEMWSNTPDIIENSSELDWYQGYCENLILFESQEQLKKIASASSLEIRVSTYAGYVDLDDDEEAVFQNSLKLFYNQVYLQEQIDLSYFENVFLTQLEDWAYSLLKNDKNP